MKRGDIRMFRFAPPDKQRPVLLLTRPDMIAMRYDGSSVSVTGDSGVLFERRKTSDRHGRSSVGARA